jgi:DNA-binding CsgD family transcriptional regulator/tetratricopeptide (TPR) repeat protein
LADAPAAQAAELAHHFLMAHNLEAALPALVAAGRAAGAVHAHPEAMRHFENALELAERLPQALATTGVDHAGIAELAALAAEANGEFARAVDLWKVAIEHVDAVADPVRAGFLWVKLGETHWLAGDLPSFVESRRTAVGLVPAQPSAERAMVLAKLASALTLSSDLGAARTLAAQAIEAARAVGARAAEGRALSALGSVAYLSGEADDAVAHLRAALHISQSLGNVGEEANDRSSLAGALHLAGHLEDGIAVIVEGIDRVGANGMERTYGETMTVIAIDLCYLGGQWDRANELAAEARGRGPRGVAAVWLNLTISEFEAWQGNFEAAHAALAMVARASVTPRIIGWTGPHEQLAQLALWEGRNADALQHAVDALDALDSSGAAIELQDRRWLCIRGLWAAADLADEARARGDVDAEARALAAADRLHQRFLVHAAASRALSVRPDPHLVVDEELAAVEHGRAHGRHDPEAWARVAASWDSMGHLPDAAQARWREAEARLLLGQPRSAAEPPLLAAADMARRLCARPLLRRIESLARRARIEIAARDEPLPLPDDLRTGWPDRLTPREREVLALVAEGRSNREIAHRLFISDKTASVHVTNIKAKLGAGTRVEAAAMAIRLGFGDEAPSGVTTKTEPTEI